MNWKHWTAIGVAGAAIVVPLLKRRMKHSGANGNTSTLRVNQMSPQTNPSPQSDTWAQSQTQ